MAKKLLMLSALVAMGAFGTGCGDDCRAFCRNQANFIDTCLPEFDQGWPDVADGEWTNKSQFVGACADKIDEHIAEEIEETCEGAAEEDLKDCENTVEQGVLTTCGDHVNDFQLSCSDFWTENTDFTPVSFDPPPPGDDDDSAGDDDDSGADDDDSSN